MAALPSRYNAVLRRLYAVNNSFKVSMQTERMVALHALVGRPLDRFQTIHVAGTNGKGSVCWKTAEALRRDGHRVGLYMGPHIASYRERVRVDGCLAEQEQVVDILEELFSLTDARDLKVSHRSDPRER
jgi:dihydrofolate synthase/folylpolyglutamate synthase